jgi:hypothetical protein
MSSSMRSCSSGRAPGVPRRGIKRECGGNGSLLLLVATVIRSPREAHGLLSDRTKQTNSPSNVGGRSDGGPGAAQRVRGAQPTREIVELLI